MTNGISVKKQQLPVDESNELLIDDIRTQMHHINSSQIAARGKKCFQKPKIYSNTIF